MMGGEIGFAIIGILMLLSEILKLLLSFSILLLGLLLPIISYLKKIKLLSKRGICIIFLSIGMIICGSLEVAPRIFPAPEVSLTLVDVNCTSGDLIVRNDGNKSIPLWITVKLYTGTSALDRSYKECKSNISNLAPGEEGVVNCGIDIKKDDYRFLHYYEICSTFQGVFLSPGYEPNCVELFRFEGYGSISPCDTFPITFPIQGSVYSSDYKKQGIDRKVIVRKPVYIDEISDMYYYLGNKTIVAVVQSHNESYSLSLPAGIYSMFVEIDGREYCDTKQGLKYWVMDTPTSGHAFRKPNKIINNRSIVCPVEVYPSRTVQDIDIIY